MEMIRTATTLSSRLSLGFLTGDCGCNGQCGSNCGINGKSGLDTGMLINPAITPVVR